jgi:hypothetical protein
MTSDRIFNPKNKVVNEKWDYTKGGYVVYNKTKVNVNRLKVLVKDFKSLKIKLVYERSYAVKTMFLPPLLESECSEEIWKSVQKRASRETMIACVDKVPFTLINSIFLGYMILGNGVYSIPYFQYLAYYLKQAGVELFTEGPIGHIRNLRYDSIAPVRVHTMVSAALLHMFGDYPHLQLHEMFFYLVQNPWPRQQAVKKMISMLKKVSFCETPLGKSFFPQWPKIDWDLIMPGVGTPKKTKVYFNDTRYVHKNEKSMKKSILQLKDAGLIELASAYDFLVHAQLNRKNLILFSILQAPQNFCGFTRNCRELAHREQVSKIPPFDIKKMTWTKAMKDVWREAILGTSRLRYMPWTQTSFLSNVAKILTSRSAGGESFRLSVFVDDEFPKSKPAKGGFVVELKFTDKTIIFMLNPSKYFKPIDLKAALEKVHKTGSRSTRLRLERAIFMIPLKEYLQSASFSKPIQDWMATPQKTISEGGGPLYGTAPFTVGKETGAPVVDHYIGLYCTSRPGCVPISADYSQFDSSERWDNTRKLMINAVIETSKELGWLTDVKGVGFCGYRNFVEMFIRVMNTRRKKKFKIGDSVVTLNQLLSGEYITLAYNGLVNLANFRSYYEILKKKHKWIFDYVSLQQIRIQGDDSIAFWVFISDLPLRDPVTYSKIMDIIDNEFVKNSQNNGLDINIDKMTTRSTYYEYLKKILVYGYAVPQYMVTSAFDAENKPWFFGPVDASRTFNSVLRVMINRGHNPKYLNWYAHIRWATGCKYSVPSHKKALKTEAYFAPPALYWTPIGLNGVGELPQGLDLPSKDGMIAFFASKHKQFRDLINMAATIFDVRITRVSDKIAEAMYDGKKTDPKDCFSRMKKFTETYVMSEERKISAGKAVRVLKKAGISLGRYSYTRFVKTYLEITMAGNRKLAEMNYLLGRDSGIEYYKRWDEPMVDLLYKNYGIMFHLKIEERKELKQRVEINFMPTLAQHKGNLIRYMGVSRERDTIKTRYLDFLTFLKRDEHWPRYIRDETLLRLLSDPRLVKRDDLVIAVLVGIGVHPQRASSAVNLYLTQAQRVSLFLMHRISSTYDDFLPILDFSLPNYQRMVSYKRTGDRVLDSVLQEIGMSYTLITAQLGGKIREVHLTFTYKDLAALYEILYGSKLYRKISLLGN